MFHWASGALLRLKRPKGDHLVHPVSRRVQIFRCIRRTIVPETASRYGLFDLCARTPVIKTMYANEFGTNVHGPAPRDIIVLSVGSVPLGAAVSGRLLGLVIVAGTNGRNKC